MVSPVTFAGPPLADHAQAGNAALLGPARLARLVRDVVDAGEWQSAVMFRASRHWFHRLELTESFEIWVLAWLPGQHTGFHDHGDAAGAFAVVQGELRERLARPGSRDVHARTAWQGKMTSFGRQHLHDVGNDSAAPAVSVHAYSPPLTAMRRYDMTASGLTLVGTDLAEEDW
ncbi:MAG TPA: cysteine dioxygenase family protein [Streptosporangiaceae bacterium]|nr:cysteine dioxygenase family protein [Streptosporangiaceae bacterium]